MPPKPPVTGTSHPLPFDRLAPLDFEGLCLWLVRREGYEQAEHLGEAGNEGGRDVVAWKGGKRFVFQCKRVQSFTAAHARKEIKKLRELPAEEQPQELVFVVSRAVSAATRKAARRAWGEESTCHFWSGSELDERAWRHQDLVKKFFQLSAGPTPGFRHNLPYPSLGPLFQGRDEMLALLRERLAQAPAGRATAIAGKAVHGLGGVGKTRLAVEYAWKHAAEYHAALFVVAGSPADLQRNLAALCEVLDLPERTAKEDEVRETAVRRWLRDNPGGWLLILDNVDSKDAAEEVDGLVANLAGGHVLLTGRLSRWAADVEKLELELLTEGDAAAFLLARTASGRRATGDDERHAGTLAQELGCLPLALEQAGAYIAERRLTFKGYLAEWREKHDAVLAWFDPQVSRYPASVAVTWQTSIDRLSPPARRLLQRLAWLGPEPIPESLLDVPVPELPEPEPDAREALVELTTYSLVTRAAETPTFTVHRLVQDVTRRSLERERASGLLAEALKWLNAAFVGDPQDVRTWPILDPLAPHAGVVVSFADRVEITGPTSRLMNQLAVLFLAKARHAEAEPLMRRVLAIDEKSLGTEHPEIAISLNNLAQLLQDTNRIAEAEPLLRHALGVFERYFGPEHPNVASNLNNLALLLQDTNRLDEAESLVRRALAIDEQSFGTEHTEVATDLSNLALLLRDTDRLAEAEPLMQRALAIDEQSLGAEHPKVAIRLNNLALLLRDTNRCAEAEPLMRRALAIEAKSFGTEHPNVARDLNNLATLLQATNRLAEAEPLMRRALSSFLGFTRRSGHEHPHLQTVLSNYRRLLKEMGKSPSEIEAAIQALATSP